MNTYKELFLLDPKEIFLNHGSFGACPRIVFEAYQAWQRHLESQPVRFLGRELIEYELQSLQELGLYLNANPFDLVYIPNATHGVNIIARSLSLGPGDEILSSNHEYGACDNTWRYICHKTGASYIQHQISLPTSSMDCIVEDLWNDVTPNTKLIYLSHITSPTALRLPIESICHRARQAGILTMVDGAHGPGQIPVDLELIGADFYTGNCHKWMLSPKGAGFLHTRQEVQSLIEPLIVSWGYSSNEHTTSGSRYRDLLQWTGTQDPSAALSVPTAIKFMEDHNWNEVRNGCNKLLRQALWRISELTGLPSIYLPESKNFPDPLPTQMGIAPLPRLQDMEILKSRLYEEYRIEVPITNWMGQHYIRISIQAYNTQDDIDVLIQALGKLLPAIRA